MHWKIRLSGCRILDVFLSIDFIYSISCVSLVVIPEWRYCRMWKSEAVINIQTVRTHTHIQKIITLFFSHLYICYLLCKMTTYCFLYFTVICLSHWVDPAMEFLPYLVSSCICSVFRVACDVSLDTFWGKQCNFKPKRVCGMK